MTFTPIDTNQPLQKATDDHVKTPTSPVCDSPISDSAIFSGKLFTRSDSFHNNDFTSLATPVSRVTKRSRISSCFVKSCCSMRTILPLWTIVSVFVTGLLVWASGFSVSFIGFVNLGSQLGHEASERAAQKVEGILSTASLINQNAVLFYERSVHLTAPFNTSSEGITAQQEDLMLEYMLSQFVHVRDQYASLNILFTNGHLYGIEFSSLEEDFSDTVIWNANRDGSTLTLYTVQWKDKQFVSNFSVPVNAYTIPTFVPTIERNRNVSLFDSVSPHVVYPTLPVTSAALLFKNKTGSVIGTVNCVIRLDQIAALLNEINPVDGSVMALMDASGKLAASTRTLDKDIDYTKTCEKATSEPFIHSMCESLANSDAGYASEGEHSFWFDSIEYDVVRRELKLPGQSYYVVTCIPKLHFTRNIFISTGITFGAAAIFIVIACLITLFVTVSFVHHMNLLSRSFRDIGSMKLESSRVKKATKLRSFVFEILNLRQNFVMMRNALDGFSRFIPARVVASFMEVGIQDHMSQQELAIFFLDFRNFTTLCERLSPVELVSRLTVLMTGMTDILEKQEVTVDSFIGDAIMAWIEATTSDYHKKICEAALQCIEFLDEHPELEVQARIGIQSGPIMLGIYGGARKKTYTCLGRHVNTAARLESLNNTYQTSILVGPAVEKDIRKDFSCRLVDRVVLKGMSEPMKVYDVHRHAVWTKEDEKLYMSALDYAKECKFSEALEELDRMDVSCEVGEKQDRGNSEWKQSGLTAPQKGTPIHTDNLWEAKRRQIMILQQQQEEEGEHFHYEGVNVMTSK